MLDGKVATTYMQAGTPNTASACLYTVWVAFGKPHTLGRLAGHTFATATEAYQYTTKRHTDRNPPPGVPVWFGSTAGPRYAGDKHWPDGDVAVSIGGGRLTATDYPTYGHIGTCTIAQREQQTGRVYLGWSEDFLGNDILYPAGTSTAAASNDGQEMDMGKLIEHPDGTVGYVSPDGHLHVLGNMDEARSLQAVGLAGDVQKLTDTLIWDRLKDVTVRDGSVTSAIYAVLRREVDRDGVKVSQIQDNANTGTYARAILAAVKTAQASLDATGSGGVDPTAIIEAAVTKALGRLTFKAVAPQ